MKKIALYVFMSTALLSAVHTYTAEDNQFVSNLRGAFSSRSGLFGSDSKQNNDEQEQKPSTAYMRELHLTGPGVAALTPIERTVCIATAKEDGTVPGRPGVRVVSVGEARPVQVSVFDSSKNNKV